MCGENLQGVPCYALPRDHPRMCGENGSYLTDELNEVGSPPHVRGKRTRWRSKQRDCGITPACAGKTFEFGHLFQLIQDHPRMCGENYFTFATSYTR